MNRNLVILGCICGLIVIGIVALIVRAVHNHEPDTSLKSELPDKFTYKDLLQANDQGLATDRKPEFNDTGGIKKKENDVMNITEAKQALSAASDPVDPLPVTASDEPPQVGQAIKAIKEEKTRLRQAQGPQNGTTEDDQIRNIVAQSNGSNTPVVTANPVQPPQDVPAPKAAGFNTLKFGSGGNGSVAAPVEASFVARAVILNSVEVATGSTVRIMLLENVNINSVTLPRQTMITGSIQVEDTRVRITVPGAALNGKLAAATFTAFGSDGIEGLPIAAGPGAATKQAAKDEINANVEQAAGGGILGSVVRVVRTLGSSGHAQEIIRIPSGTKIILKIEPK